jgi:hypothetical protein
VFVNDLKAVYIVRDFIGDPSYEERKKSPEIEKPSAGVSASGASGINK